MADAGLNGQQAAALLPGGRRRRQPATGAERDRRDAWAQTWAPAGREVGDRVHQERELALSTGSAGGSL